MTALKGFVTLVAAGAVCVLLGWTYYRVRPLPRAIQSRGELLAQYGATGFLVVGLSALVFVFSFGVGLLWGERG